MSRMIVLPPGGMPSCSALRRTTGGCRNPAPSRRSSYDPIMGLLWRADRLEPIAARAAMIGLRAIVRRANGQRLDRPATPERRRSLAA